MGMSNKECLNRIAKLVEELAIADITKEEAIEALKDASFNEIAEELWRYYCFVCDIKGVLMEKEEPVDTVPKSDYNRLKTGMLSILANLDVELGEHIIPSSEGKECVSYEYMHNLIEATIKNVTKDSGVEEDERNN